MMVAAPVAAVAKNRSIPQVDLTRSPLIPSEKDNAAATATTAAASRRPRIKEVTSRYLSSHSSSSSTSNSTTITTASSSSSSSSSSSRRRFPSPLVTPRAPALSSRAAPKRAQSVDRARPVTPRPDPPRNAGNTDMSAAARVLCTTTRSISVSFQGESFFYQTSKAKAGAPSPARKPTPERRRTATTPLRSGRGSEGDQHVENSRPGDQHRWPASRTKQSNLLTRSLDCSMDKKEPLFSAVRMSQMGFDEGARASFDGSVSSEDTESVSSGGNSVAHESGIPARARVNPRGIVVPARFLQETNSRLQRLSEQGTPMSSPIPRSLKQPKLVSAKKSLMSSTMSSPRSASPLRGPIRPSSPIKVVPSPSRAIPSRAMASPSRTRSNGATVGSSPIGQPGPAPSILTFAAEVRRAKYGENKIEEAHLLRLLYNRHLQWCCVNARANAALTVQRFTAEKTLYNAWIALSEMRDSVTIKKIRLQLLRQNLKLSSILREQMVYLEEWSRMDKEHSGSLFGAIEALKASTLRLPVVAGARADIQNVKETIGSAVDVMQAMGSSICSLLSKVEGTNSLVSDLTKAAAQERALLAQARDLLSMVAVMHVKECSLRGQMLQLKRKAREARLSSS